jgi:hypothetical protein
MELDKSSFNLRFSEYIKNLIICSAIFKRDNVLMNQLSQIVSMDLNMLHITLGNMIVNNLYGIVIIIVYCSRGMNMKAKFTQKLEDPDCFSIFLNDAMIFGFCSRQGEYLMFIARPHQRSSAKEKHIAISGLSIIIFTNKIRVGESD